MTFEQPERGKMPARARAARVFFIAGDKRVRLIGKGVEDTGNRAGVKKALEGVERIGNCGRDALRAGCSVGIF